MISFEWDDEKNQSNFEKHKVWFEEAQTVWADEKSAEFFDETHSDSEDRYIRIGFSSRERILLIIFCERSDGDAVRIISARKATKFERGIYEEGI